MSSTFEMDEFQSTLPLRGATRHRVLRPCPGCYFNPHSPCGERLAYTYATPSLIWTLFQSTLPLRGATRQLFRVTGERYDFNPHSPCGERLALLYVPSLTVIFQSTLPLRGATDRMDELCRDTIKFQSTLPLRGATRVVGDELGQREISIHTPLAGSDPTSRYWTTTTANFNPHSPCGERPAMETGDAQSVQISIHTPLAGSDRRNETFLTK